MNTCISGLGAFNSSEIWGKTSPIIFPGLKRNNVESTHSAGMFNHVCFFASIKMSIYIHIYIYIHILIYIYICIYTYIPTYIYIYIHM